MNKILKKQTTPAVNLGGKTLGVAGTNARFAFANSILPEIKAAETQRQGGGL